MIDGGLIGKTWREARMGATLSMVLVAAGAILVLLATRPKTQRRPSGPLLESDDPMTRAGEHRAMARRPILRRGDELQRLRTDRRDLQLSVGRDFGAPEIRDRTWPPTW
jgi:hypothetical protein